VTVVGETGPEDVVVEVAGDLLRDQHRAHRRIAGGQRLRHGDDVRLDAFVLDGEGAAGATQAGEDLVGDQQRPVAIARGAHAREEAGRRDVHAVGAGDRLEEDGGDRAPLAGQDLGQLVLVIVDEPEDAGQERLERRAAVVAGQAERAE
jgi:hypothetical protein